MNIGNVAFKNDDHYLFLFTVKAGNRRVLGKQKITSRIVGKQYLLMLVKKVRSILVQVYYAQFVLDMGMRRMDINRIIAKLLSLKNEYLKQVEQEDPGHQETLLLYTECIEAASNNLKQNPMSVAIELIKNPDFQQCLEDINASLYLPLLEFVRMIFKGHKYLSVTLIEGAPDHLIQLLAELSVHLRLAHESLEHEEDNKESVENFDVLYTSSEAKTIVELTANLIKSIIDSKAEVVTFIALRDPAIIEWISKCSTLMKSRNVARIAMILGAEEEKVREIELKTAAALIIQAFWRMIVQRRKYHRIRDGFVKLQCLVRRTLRTRENILLEQFKTSEKEFEMQLQAVKERRRKQERVFESIKNTPSYKLNSLFQLKQSTMTEIPKYEGDDVKDDKEDEVKAAKIIQNAVRRWLHKRLYDNLARSQPFLNLPITEERAIKLQQEIDHWQYKNKVPPMTTPNELGELHSKAQMRYAKFCQGLVQSRRQEQKTMAVIAQSKTIMGILETKPSLHEYDPSNDWARFHSLPLHIATKARLEHKRAMSKLNIPHWQRILQSDD